MNESIGLIRDLAGATLLLDPERRKLLAALRDAPDSASGLARRLGESRQRLNYHLRSLEAAGLVELETERRRGNCTERILRATAGRFVVDPGALGELPPTSIPAGDRFSANVLIGLASRAIRETAEAQGRARRKGKRLATGSLDVTVRIADPSAFPAFLNDLATAVREVAERYGGGTQAEGRPFRVMLGVHPAPEPSGREAGTETTTPEVERNDE